MRQFSVRGLCGVVGVGLSVAVLGAASPAYASTDVAHWNMDELSGATTMVDTSPNGFDGSLFGAVVTGTYAGVSTQTGWAYQFNNGATCNSSTSTTTGSGYAVVTGGTVGVSSATQPTFNPGTQPFTVSTWVKTAATPGTGICDFDLIRKGGGWKMEIYPFSHVAQPNCVWNGIINATHVKVGLHARLPTGAINDGAWHQITCRRTASGEALIVGGQILASSAVNVGSIKNTAHVVVGAQEKGLDFYQGLMDDTSFTVG
ncbi:MAG: LamG domain-containing protein [Actinomycetota bacterium]|nr:LamG domain-containing protein [Actinomycetota bacterium]